MSMLPYFPYNPFEWWAGSSPDPYTGTGGESSGFAIEDSLARWRPSAAMREADPWRYGNWMNTDNVTVLSGNEKDGYEVLVKTGDKEGTVYHLLPDDKGGYVSKEVGKRGWDTNGTVMDRLGPLLPFLGAAGAHFLPQSLGQQAAAPIVDKSVAAGLGGGASDALIWETAIGTGAAGAPPATGAAGAAGAGSLAKWLGEKLGIGETAASVLLGLGPAALTLIDRATSDPEDNQVKRTGDPQIDAARRGLVESYMAEFPQLRQRSRDVSDQMLGYARSAAAIPASLPQARGIMEVDPETGRVRLRRPGGIFG